MSAGDIVILVLFGLFIVLPTTTYMVVKFGAAGYYRAKQKAEKNKTKEKHEQI